MEQEILRCLPKNWNVFILNGNAPPASAALRKQVQKLNPKLSKPRRVSGLKPMVVLLYFENGYIITHKSRKHKQNPVRIIQQDSEDKVNLRPIENSINVINVPVRESTPEIDVLHLPLKSPIRSEQQEATYVLAEFDHSPDETIVNDLERLKVNASPLMFDRPTSSPLRFTNIMERTNSTNDNNNEILNENNTENLENIHDVNDESDCIDLIKLKDEHAKIIDQWNEQVQILTKQFNHAKETLSHIKKELNNVILQRDLIKSDLEKQLNEKILEYKQQKSYPLKSKKHIKRAGLKEKTFNIRR